MEAVQFACHRPRGSGFLDSTLTKSLLAFPDWSVSMQLLSKGVIILVNLSH